MDRKKMKRTLGFAAAYGAAVGLVVSGSAMFSVGNVGGTAGYATCIAALIALIPMMATAFAYGELTAMLPGGGMISDYTTPALGRFFGAFALISGYGVLIACDGGTQLIMGGESMNSLCGTPQLLITLILAATVILINIFGVDFYGKSEAFLTIIMMGLFALVSFLGFFHAGEHFGAVPVNANLSFVPKGGWKSVFGSVGTAVWFFIGFEFACPMAEENKKPYKNIPYALIFGLISIYVLDSVFASASVRYTNLKVLSSSAIPHVEAARAMLGQFGFVTMTILTILASFTSANSYCAALPRMMYGMAREGMVPKFLGRINPKTRTPVNGVILTGSLMLITIIYITVNGANASVVSSLISVACITWMISYIIAMIDVLVLRKKYPDYPRLWKAPFAKVTMPLGIAGCIYAIWTLSSFLTAAVICMIVVALYCLIWMKIHGIEMFKPEPIETLARDIQERSEYLEGWDEAVTEWLKGRQNQGEFFDETPKQIPVDSCSGL